MSKSRSAEPKPAWRRAGQLLPLPANLADAKEALVIVAIGASAGGLEACRKLLDALPGNSGLAFILVQHLDPNHDSLLVNLLATHTRMPVSQARNGLLIERDHLYIIPPGNYLSIDNGALRLSQPQARHGARLPFDFLLHSLAAQCAERGVAVILSGTGADGSQGLTAVKEQGGYIIAQEPDEAGYGGMPRSAIHTTLVDQVLTVAHIPAAVIAYATSLRLSPGSRRAAPEVAKRDWLADIIELLRTKTAHDFTHYKQGTLRRRIARRLAVLNFAPDDMEKYIDVLRADVAEMDRLAADMLINVTSFFRDPTIFTHIAETIVPMLAHAQSADHPIRIWIAGCSTGEEAYSLAIVFREKLAEIRRNVKLQVFASDVDPDAVAVAREGLYDNTIEADVTAERRARFFVREGRNYRVSRELRAEVVFTTHDLLADPPYARLDLISCRNVMIYLAPEAQHKVLSVFHFALRDGGALILGSSETIADNDSRYQSLSKSDRFYRHIGHGRSVGLHLIAKTQESERVPIRAWRDRASYRQTSLAELCRRLVLETYAPAAILINRQHECLYSLGPVNRYLTIASGFPSTDLLVIVRENIRTKLRAAIQRAGQENAQVVIAGGRADRGSQTPAYRVSVQPLVSDGEELFLICFIADPEKTAPAVDPISATDASQIGALERELEETRRELQDTISDLKISHEEQRATDEEASSVNEEYQSANEELLTSKEELQSLNEELVTLNHQLQETLGRERMVFDDLQNVMHSTDVATLFLDIDLNIRLFTPATKALFGILPLDVGRPLMDFKSYADDSFLIEEAQTVLRTSVPMERDVETASGVWFHRSILPYRSQEDTVEGVVITFTDVTDQRRISEALELAKRQADQANLVKSRFLAMASHDLRQPLQTLTLLQGLLARQVSGTTSQKLVERFEDTLDAMSGILNTLLDINRIEAGTVHAEIENFSLNDILNRLCNEFSYHAQAKGLQLHHVRCGTLVRSDPRLLEQILRNFLSNALKYTSVGKVLVGCRREQGGVRIEIWDTGIGIPKAEQQAVFDEYHQLENSARERSRGLGLGLSIVRQLGRLLDHRVSVRSQPGKGSVFSIVVPVASDQDDAGQAVRPNGVADAAISAARRTWNFLVIEDDPAVRELLVLLLEEGGHAVRAAPNGPTALAHVHKETVRPDLILADFNLPEGMTGIQATLKLRELYRYQIPAIILTGDISTALLRDIGQHDCMHLNKPVKLIDLMDVIGRLLAETQSSAPPHPATAVTTDKTPRVHVVDDDEIVRDSLRLVLEGDGQVVETYPSSEAFLAANVSSGEGCLLVDANLPGMDGLSLLRHLASADCSLSSIMITGYGDIAMAVHAMQAGAIDFIEKPVRPAELLVSVHRALALARDSGQKIAWQNEAAAHISGLTPRQREIMQYVLAGHPSKNIAADLGISQRTVENHRAEIMKRTSTKSLPALARLAMSARATSGEKAPP